VKTNSIIQRYDRVKTEDVTDEKGGAWADTTGIAEEMLRKSVPNAVGDDYKAARDLIGDILRREDVPTSVERLCSILRGHADQACWAEKLEAAHAADIESRAAEETLSADADEPGKPKRRKKQRDANGRVGEAGGAETRKKAKKQRPSADDAEPAEKGVPVPVRIQDIKTAEPFRSIFPVDKEIVAGIAESMKTGGYDNAYPVTIWDEWNVLLDGHMRVQAARKAGLAEVLAVRRFFATEGDAVEFVLRTQGMRRNLTDPGIIDVLRRVENWSPRGRPRRGENPQACGFSMTVKRAGELLGISERKVAQARRIIKNGDEELLARIRTEDLSLYAADKELGTRKKREAAEAARASDPETHDDTPDTTAPECESAQKDAVKPGTQDGQGEDADNGATGSDALELPKQEDESETVTPDPEKVRFHLDQALRFCGEKRVAEGIGICLELLDAAGREAA